MQLVLATKTPRCACERGRWLACMHETGARRALLSSVQWKYRKMMVSRQIPLRTWMLCGRWPSMGFGPTNNGLRLSSVPHLTLLEAHCQHWQDENLSLKMSCPDLLVHKVLYNVRITLPRQITPHKFQNIVLHTNAPFKCGL